MDMKKQFNHLEFGMDRWEVPWAILYRMNDDLARMYRQKGYCVANVLFLSFSVEHRFIAQVGSYSF